MADWITEFISSLGYVGIALLMILENVFPPIPSELIMPVAGFEAANGKLSLWGVIFAGALGSTLGQLPLYYLGRWVGGERIARWVERRGEWLGVRPKDLDRAQKWFDQHGSKAIFACRLVPGLRSLISVPAGIANVPVWKFLGVSAAGIVLWTGVLAWLGAKLGEHYEKVGNILGPVGTIVLGGLVVLWIARVIRTRRQRSRGELTQNQRES
ncbi:MAG: DedA family protein [Chthoniobacterales bacterium]